MKQVFRICVFIVLLLAAASPVLAQNSSIFIGGSFTHNGDLPKSFTQLSTLKSGNIGGVDVLLSARLAGIFHLALNVDAARSSTADRFTFLAGPEVVLGKNFQLSAHALVGGAKETEKGKAKLGDFSESAFAYALGGGIKYFPWKHVGFGVDANGVYTDAFGEGFKARIAAGIAFRW